MLIEMKKRRIFQSVWLKLKHLFQDIAILVFLIVLCIFSYTEGDKNRSSQLLDSLEIIVIIAIGVAICCEVLLMLYTIFESFVQMVQKVRNSLG